MAEVPAPVVRKLLFFTAMMIITPLAAFFATRSVTDNSIISGGVAAFAANAVMVLYVYVAFNEDVGEPIKETKAE